MPIGTAVLAVGAAPAATVVSSDPTGCVRTADLQRRLHWLPDRVAVDVSSSVDAGRFGLDVSVDPGSGRPLADRVVLAREDCATDAVGFVERAVRQRMRVVEAARALVDVRDAHRCLDVAAAAEGLVDVFGKRADRLAAGVDIAEIESTLLVTIRASCAPESAWVDDEAIVAGDCPSLAALVVDSIERGCGDIDRPPWPPGMRVGGSVGAGVTSAPEPHAGLSVGRYSENGPVAPYVLGRAAFAGAPAGVTRVLDPDSGASALRRRLAAWVELRAGAGLRFEGPSSGVQSRLQVLAGPAVAFGVGYPDSELALLPAVGVGPGLDVPLGDWTLTADLCVAPPFVLGTAFEPEQVTTAWMQAEIGLAFMGGSRRSPAPAHRR